MSANDSPNEHKENVATLHDNTNTPRDDRKARGVVLRSAVPLESHAGWTIPPNRPDPLSILADSDQGRLQELLPIRYGRMAKTPFTFFRGSAPVMAFDLSTTPISRVSVQSCGDCHALNFGAFATPERNVVFDLNDFDETLPGPWEWDLKRLVVSLVLIARDNGLKSKVEAEAVEACVQSYRTKITEYSKLSILDIWYEKIEWESVVASASSESKSALEQQLTKAQKQTVRYHYFPKMTQQKDDNFVIKDNPPLIYHRTDDAGFVDRMTKGFELYRQSLQEDRQRLLDRYKIADIAMKVVGVGSVGTTCAIALMLGVSDNFDPLFLQIKEARQSVLEKYVGKSTFDNQGQRVVAGQRIIQSASDIFLGWMRLENGKDFYVRQLRDTKVKLETEDWGGKQLVAMGRLMGNVLARAHARSGDSTVIAAYLGEADTFDRAVADFAISYTNQVEHDHSALAAAIRSGRIKANTDV